MKKVFAIIAIMVVLVGAVFAEAPATGYATLKVVTLVETFEPAFKLITSGSSTSGNLIADETTRVPFAKDSNAATLAALATDNIADDEYHVIDKNTLIAASGNTTVNFQVIQSAPSKSYKTYTLTATATDLIMVKAFNNSGELVDYTGTATTANHRVFGVVDGTNGTATVSNFAAGTAISVATNELSTTGSTGSAFKVTYGGALVEANAQIATFSCSWANDANGVPGQYEADVILHVTAN